MENNINYKQRNMRNSSIEILRIISIVIIVLHHACLHGGAYLYGNHAAGIFSIFIIPLGKIFFCLFAIISCWFLIDAKLKSKRFFKLWLSTFIYNIIFLIISLLIPNYDIATGSIIKSFFPIFGFGVTHGYISGFLLFLFILPFVKMLYENISYKAILIIFVMLFLLNMYSLKLGNLNLIEEVIAFITIFTLTYFVKRVYVISNLNKIKYLFLFLFIINISLSILIFYLDLKYANPITSRLQKYLFSDERCIINIITALSLFLFVISLPSFNNKIINYISGFTFDVLLIHDSGLLRNVIWSDLFKSSNYYGTNLFFVWLLIVVLIILVVGFICYVIRNLLLNFIFKFYNLNMFCEKVDNFCSSCFITNKKSDGGC